MEIVTTNPHGGSGQTATPEASLQKLEPQGLGSLSWKIGLGCPNVLWQRMNKVLLH